MKEREEVELSKHIFKSFMDDDYEEYNENEDLGFKFIEQDTIYTDMGKGYTTKNVILQRKNDNKYFKFHYYDSNYISVEEGNIFPLKLTEVFPKIVKTTIYE